MTYNRHDAVYHNLLREILEQGEVRKNRTGVDTIGIFGKCIEFPLKDTFPALTTKRMAWKAIVTELLWFLRGDQDERNLAALVHDVQFNSQEEYEDSLIDPKLQTIWTANATADYWMNRGHQLYPGDAGRVYGVQWRRWETFRHGMVEEIDQIENLINGLKNDPYGRRHIITAWNPGELDKMCLPPCHILAQFNVTNDGHLECHMYQRSVDTFLGLPFNIASYALLTHIIAQCTNLKPGRLIMSLGDVHIYSNHIDQVKEQLARESREEPKLLMLNPTTDLSPYNSFKFEDFKLTHYNPHPAIKAPMAV